MTTDVGVEEHASHAGPWRTSWWQENPEAGKRTNTIPDKAQNIYRQKTNVKSGHPQKRRRETRCKRLLTFSQNDIDAPALSRIGCFTSITCRRDGADRGKRGLSFGKTSITFQPNREGGRGLVLRTTYARRMKKHFRAGTFPCWRLSRQATTEKSERMAAYFAPVSLLLPQVSLAADVIEMMREALPAPKLVPNTVANGNADE